MSLPADRGPAEIEGVELGVFGLDLDPDRVLEADSLERLVASEIVLRQRGAFIGEFGLLPDDRERSGKAVLAKRDCRLRAAVAAADDEDVKVAQAFSFAACQSSWWAMTVEMK